jgi:putative hydrolase of the HAD superfamily
MRYSLDKTLKELRSQISSQQAMDLTVEEMIRIRDEVAEELKNKVINLREIRLRAFERTLEYVGAGDKGLSEDLTRFYLTHRSGGADLYSETKEVVEKLSKDYRLGLISNGYTDPEGFGLGKYFDFVVFSHEHGIAKPDPGLFKIALDKGGCLASETIHVGDSLEDDIYGAKLAGIKNVWLNRNGDELNGQARPDHEIRYLHELYDVLNNTEK